MTTTCPRCRATTTPDQGHCCECGAVLTLTALTAPPQSWPEPAVGLGPSPAPGTAPPPAPKREANRTRAALVAVGAALVALVIVGVLAIGGDGSDADDGALSGPTSTLPRPSTTATAPPTTPPQGEPADLLGAVLPANEQVVWRDGGRSWDPDAFDSSIRELGLVPTAVERMVGLPIHPDGPTLAVVAVQVVTPEDVRTRDFMRWGITPGTRYLTFDVAGRPAVYGSPDENIMYLFGVRRDVLLVVIDVSDSGPGPITEVSEAIVEANP